MHEQPTIPIKTDRMLPTSRPYAKEPIKQTLKTNIRSEVLHEEKYLFESTRTITSPRFRKNTQTLCNQKEIHPIRPYRQLLSP